MVLCRRTLGSCCCCCCCCCCCFSHSAHWLPTRKKLLYTVTNPARGLLNREKKRKKKAGSAPPPPPPPPRAARSEKRKKKRKITRRIHMNAIGTKLRDPKLGTHPMAYGGFINGRRRGTREESRKDWQPFPVDPYSTICIMTIHIYIHPVDPMLL